MRYYLFIIDLVAQLLKVGWYCGSPVVDKCNFKNILIDNRLLNITSINIRTKTTIESTSDITLQFHLRDRVYFNPFVSTLLNKTNVS